MKKKTKLTALFLALIMALSLATPAFAYTPAPTSVNNPSPSVATGAYGGNPYAPVILGPGTVVVEDQNNLIHVFLEDQVVVTMDVQFVLNYTATGNYKSRGFSSKGGYAWLAEEAINRALNEKTVARAADGNSCTYGEKATHLSTATGEALPVDYIITAYFRQPVKELRTLDTVSYTLTHQNGKTVTSTITVRAYGEATPTQSSIYALDSIWAVREVDDYTIEVYLRNGMIVTLAKQMVVDWVDSRQNLGKTFGIDSWHDRYEMDDDGAVVCESFCQTLLDDLIRQDWTVFPTKALEPGYEYQAFPATGVMRPDVKSDLVLARAMEKRRTADTSSDITIYFDYYNRYGRLTHSVPYQMRFEFICRNIVTSASASGAGNATKPTVNDFNFYSLAKPEYFLRSYNAAQKAAWLTDAEIAAISR